MFNNAGFSGAVNLRFLDDDLQDFQRVMAVDLFGVMVGSQRAARHMASAGAAGVVRGVWPLQRLSSAVNGGLKHLPLRYRLT